jgi:hypothetical protein
MAEKGQWHVEAVPECVGIDTKTRTKTNTNTSFCLYRSGSGSIETSWSRQYIHVPLQLSVISPVMPVRLCSSSSSSPNRVLGFPILIASCRSLFVASTWLDSHCDRRHRTNHPSKQPSTRIAAAPQGPGPSTGLIVHRNPNNINLNRTNAAIEWSHHLLEPTAF